MADGLNFNALVADLNNSFQSGKTLTYEYRIQQLQQFGLMIDENEDAIYEALYKDLHKCKVESDLMEVMQVRIELGHAIQNLKHWMKPERVSPDLINKLNTCEIRREPFGLVLVIGSWNYPIQLLLLPAVGVMAAGNCFVLKPSELAPNCASLLEKIIPKYLDPECYRLVAGGIPESTALLKQRWDHIMYTGSSAVGKIVMKAASEHLTPVTLELGGKCPAVIDHGCSIDVIAQRICWAKFSNAGQTCLAVDYVLCMEDCVDAFIASVVKAVTSFYSADPQKSDSYGRIVNARHFKRIAELIDQSKVAFGGVLDESDLYIAPTIMKGVAVTDRVMQEEIFGPLLPIIAISSIDEAIAIIRKMEKPLAAYIFSNDKANIDRFVSRTSSGGCVVNDALVHGAVPSLPFGGVGNSGMGAYHGKFSFDTFSHKKSTLIKNQSLESVNSVRYPPYDANWTPMKFVQWMITPSQKPSRRFSVR